MIKRAGLLLLGLAVVTVALAAETFQIDPMHSGAMFRIKHMGISTVSGRFDRFTGSIDYDEKNPKSWKASATIETASVNTNIGKRDDHLRSAEYFDAAQYPQIVFKSGKVSAVKENKAKLEGNLTMHGVTRPVVLDLEIGGTMKDQEGKTHLGAAATTSVSRKDFAVGKETPMLGDKVDIILEIEAVPAK
ncbi:MAG: hypothetical protein A3J74_00550 [Elusimicrobia bacterium RIFCSPHIGHO2_02_FULL_57_9]|nr:MAG: hypothetical protein A3J74_00550 [Elusimicrobia bacterium RIFCSPHIGHO2_02_FULL_57_9]